MSDAVFAGRGDQAVDLGELGTIVCRPGWRALEAIEEASQTKALGDVAQGMAQRLSLRMVVTILHECHLDYAAAEPVAQRFTRPQIADAVADGRLALLRPVAFALVLHAFGESKKPKAPEDDQGNG